MPYISVEYSKAKIIMGIVEPKTNADRIRSMSDEELAEFIFEVIKGHIHRGIKCEICKRNDCVPCWLDWLKQEVSDDQQRNAY